MPPGQAVHPSSSELISRTEVEEETGSSAPSAKSEMMWPAATAPQWPEVNTRQQHHIQAYQYGIWWGCCSPALAHWKALNHTTHLFPLDSVTSRDPAESATHADDGIAQGIRPVTCLWQNRHSPLSTLAKLSKVVSLSFVYLKTSSVLLGGQAKYRSSSSQLRGSRQAM